MTESLHRERLLQFRVMNGLRSFTMPGAAVPSRNCTDFANSDGLVLYITRVKESLQLIVPSRAIVPQAVCAFSEPSL
jgi:hypothetical protein